jgi:murein DD-endopeptidase MepM/ murein hydrolase activator NlpD
MCVWCPPNNRRAPTVVFGSHDVVEFDPMWSQRMPRVATVGLVLLSAWIGFKFHDVYDAPGTGRARIAKLLSAPQPPSLTHALRLVEFEGLRRPDGGGPLAAPARARALGLGTLRAGTALLSGRPDPAWVLAADAFGRRSATLAWPVAAGWLTRGYGSGADGYHLATDIMAATGAQVRAAGDALVGYADDGVRGYGNMVMLIHAGGAITAYAHNSRNLVQAGQVVKRGELIAEVGSTGISRGPHVHFELMVDGRNCDPSALFRPGVPHRDGKPAEIAKQRWEDDSKHPPVHCERRRRHPNSRYVDHEGDTEAHFVGDEDDGEEVSTLTNR